ncbi:M28 family peptidase [bacterium]|nr:M28 family peptidase [bacterium]
MRGFIKIQFSLILIIILGGNGCAQSQIPTFDEVKAFDYLKIQCQFGPRYPGSVGHKNCLEFLVRELKETTDRVIQQPFIHTLSGMNKTITMTNVIASFGDQGDRLLLCAHWDTRPWADRDPDPENRDKPIIGANDGASGVAVLLEMAQILRAFPPAIGVDIVLFDGEDSGTSNNAESWCLGSRYFAQQKQAAYLPRYAILLDMIGDNDLHIPIERNSQRYAPEIVNKVWSKAEELGLDVFDRSLGYQMIDDHLELLRVGIPAIDIIDFDYPYWHTLQDTEDKCSPESLNIIGTLLVHLIYE